jgi:dihydrodipicolinate synthase/N-acetylneuraminate lyase
MPDFFTMCATVFSPHGGIDEVGFRGYLQRQIDARLGIYLGSGGNGETHAMTPEELHTMYRLGVETCRGKVPVHANLPEEHAADATIAQARIAIEAAAVPVALLSRPATASTARPAALTIVQCMKLTGMHSRAIILLAVTKLKPSSRFCSPTSIREFECQVAFI